MNTKANMKASDGDVLKLLKRVLDRDGGTRGSYIDLNEVERLVGVDEGDAGAAAIQAMVSAGRFPAPNVFSPRPPQWKAGDLLDWVWSLFDTETEDDEARKLLRQSYLIWCVHEHQKLAAFFASQASVWGDTGLQARLLELLPRAARSRFGG